MLIFDIFRPRPGLLGSAVEHWQRYRMRGGLPIGVVAGPANALPREWARAWQVCRAGDGERMQQVRAVVEAFRSATEVVAAGTPALAAPDADRFDARYEAVREAARAQLGPPWVTVVP
jgi:hypothetical protein